MEKLEQEKNSQQELKNLKTLIQQYIDYYNSLSDEEALKLSDEKKSNQEEKINVSNYLICKYATRHSSCLPKSEIFVGLFTKRNYNYIYNDLLFGREIVERIVYTSVDDDLIAVRKGENDFKFVNIGESACLDGKKYMIDASCWIWENNIYGFDQIRQKMYQEGRIDTYERGIATNKEILDVLDYVSEMLDLKIAKDKSFDESLERDIEMVQPLKQEETILSNTDRQNHIITLINKELKSSIQSIKASKNIEETVLLKDIFAVFGSDNSFMFAKEIRRLDWLFIPANKFYSLRNVFVNNCLNNEEYSWDSRPWSEGKIFQIAGIDSIAITASKFIPLDLIEYGNISKNNLKKINIAIQNYLIEHPEFIASIFPDKSIAHLEKK